MDLSPKVADTDVITGISLCSGYGGMDLGIELAEPSFRSLCYVEREAYPAALLASHIEEGSIHPAPIWSDLATFDGKPWHRLVDIVLGGFPCQPWSNAGKRKGIADERWIWDDIAKIITDVEPSICFFENVPGLISGGGLSHVLKTFADFGFNAEWGVFSAKEVGAPHLRKRVFILANNNNNGFGQQRSQWILRRQRQTQLGHDIDGCGRAHVADSDSRRLSFGEDKSRNDPSQRSAIKRSGRNGLQPTSLWPPRRDPALWPDINAASQPSFLRMVNGNSNELDSNWTERIRATGNGCVPLVAAYAFRTLANQLTE